MKHRALLLASVAFALLIAAPAFAADPAPCPAIDQAVTTAPADNSTAPADLFLPEAQPTAACEDTCLSRYQRCLNGCATVLCRDVCETRFESCLCGVCGIC